MPAPSASGQGPFTRRAFEVLGFSSRSGTRSTWPTKIRSGFGTRYWFVVWRRGQRTDRECEVLASVARGLSDAEIASELIVSNATVKTHIGHR